MARYDLAVLADESKFNGFHAKILAWCLFVLICDGYDLAVVGATLPVIMDDMDIEATSAGVMAGSALFGTMMGAIFLGTLSDRIGRRRMMAICVALFSLFTAGAGLTSDPIAFSAMRFVAGLGIGGVLPIATAQMSEFAPLRLRTRLVTLVFAGYSVGGILVALTAKYLIEEYGWQSVFFVAGLPVVAIPFILRSMPESIAYMISQGRQEDLASVACRLAPDIDFAGAEFTNAADTASGASVSQLFEKGRAWGTVMIWVGFITGLFMVYALNSWLTKLMAMAGHSLGSALDFVIMFNIGSIVGAALGGFLGDKFNIKRVLVGFYLTGAASLTLLAYSEGKSLLFLVVFLVGATTLGTQLLAYAFAGNYYPAEIRATGVGFASGMGRIGAIAAPVLIGWLISLNLPLEQNFMAISVAGLIGAAAIALIGNSHAASGNLAERQGEAA
jgi:Sugar phosphate permease